MSRWLVRSLAVAVLLGVSPAVRAADDDPKEIIAKAIKAHGGEEYLTKIQGGETQEPRGRSTSPVWVRSSSLRKRPTCSPTSTATASTSRSWA